MAMRVKACAGVIGAMLSGSLLARTIPDTVRAYELEWGEKPLKIDADFSDWTRLEWSGAFTRNDGTLATNAACRFALMRDRTNLYIAFRMDGEYCVSDTHVQHDGDIWKGNSVAEFFFARSGSSAGYVQLSLAANGDRQDGADGDSFVTPEWDAVTRCDASGWQGEMRVPFSAIDVDVNVDRQYEFQMNVSVGLPKHGIHDEPGSLSWSHGGGPCYRSREDMGFVVYDDFRAGCDRAKAAYLQRYGEACGLSTVRLGDESAYLAFKNAFAIDCAIRDRRRAEAIAAKIAAMPDLPSILGQVWSPDLSFDENPTLQANVLESALKAIGTQRQLDFRVAVNEIAHKSFAVSARQDVNDLSFSISDLVSDTGKTIPANKLHVEKFAFLHPVSGYHRNAKMLDLGYPEIIERVRGKIAVRAGESLLFRLYVDTRGVMPGKYAGICKANATGGAEEFRVSLEVMDIVLPIAEDRTFPVYLFTTIPWGGESAELWAEFFRDHYMTDVAFEHPKVYCKGQEVKPYDGDAHRGWRGYIEGMVATNPVPSGADIHIDVKRHQLDERLRACAKYRLRPVLSNRNGFLKSEHFPALVSAFGACGIPPGDIIYKLGDEDASLLFLPVAKRIREVEPRIRLIMIPSGTAYWDIKPAIAGFTDFTFSRAAFRVGPKGDADLRFLQSKGVVLSRYINDASWAGRTMPVAARAEPWAALIVDGTDGYACWTANIWPDIGYRVPYGGYSRSIRFQDLPPERQIPEFLVYMRKIGDVYHPVSCIRLENIRDGLIDALYFRLARQTCEKRGDTAGLKRLEALRVSNKRTIADYDAARKAMSDIIMGL